MNVLTYHRFGFSSSVNIYQAFGYTCDGTESELAECTQRGSICAADSVEHAVAISCGAVGSDDDDIVGT